MNKNEVEAPCEDLAEENAWLKQMQNAIMQVSQSYVLRSINAEARADALQVENEELTNNLNLKADFIEKTVDQLAAAEARAIAAESKAEAMRQSLERYEQCWVGTTVDIRRLNEARRLSAHKGEG